MTLSEAKQDLARKLNIDYADIANNQLVSDADLTAWIQAGVHKAWDFKPWDFTEGDKKTTSISAEYYDYPQDFQSGSINLLLVGGEEFRKLSYKAYRLALEKDPSSTEKIWAERKRFYFINQNAYTAGAEIVLFGKLKAPTLTNANDLLPFSPDSDNEEYSGNGAIVRLAYSEALGSRKYNNPSQAKQEQQDAYAILELLWKPFEDSRSDEQTENVPMFNVPDFFQ